MEPTADQVRAWGERLDTRISMLSEQLGRIEAATKRIEANHNEVRARIEKTTRAVRMALPVIRKMIG